MSSTRNKSHQHWKPGCGTEQAFVRIPTGFASHPADDRQETNAVALKPIAASEAFREETGMRTLARRSVFIFALAALLVSATSAYADTIQFSYTGNGVTASGVMYATPLGGGAYQVTSISGTRNGQAITGLIPCTPIPPETRCTAFGFGFDNLIAPASALQLDFEGLLFGVQGLPSPVNLFGYTNAGLPAYDDLTWVFAPDGIHREYTNVQVDLTTTLVTPEPSTVLLLASGLIAIAGAVRRKRIRQ